MKPQTKLDKFFDTLFDFYRRLTCKHPVIIFGTMETLRKYKDWERISSCGYCKKCGLNINVTIPSEEDLLTPFNE